MPPRKRKPISASSFKFFKNLVESPSPSGFEQPAQRVWREYVEGSADEIASDVIGNSWGVLNGSSKSGPKVMLAGHCDEIGFIIKHIDKEGYLYVGTVGGHDPALFAGQRLDIHGRNGVVRGVFGRQPVHMIPQNERGKVGKVHEHFVDIGANDKDDALTMVSVGDVMTYSVGVEEMSNNIVCSRAFDDKVGSYIVAEVIRLLSEGKKPAATLYGVSTVQEEVGLRGAKTSAFAIEPDVGIAIEVGFASDHPGMDNRRTGETKLAGGPVIATGPNVNPMVFEKMVAAAEKIGIEYQVDAVAGATGTDANVMQINRAGCAAGLVSVPLRYMHSPVEAISLKDLDTTARMVAQFVRSLSARTEFIPS